MLKKYDLNESVELGLYTTTYVKNTLTREELLGADIQCSAVLIYTSNCGGAPSHYPLGNASRDNYSRVQ